MTAEHVFTLPDLGEGLEAAEVSQWLVSEGDAVALNQPLVEVNTEKALVEIPSPVAGVVGTLHASEGDEVAVGAPLVTFLVEEREEGGRKPVLVGYGVKEDEPSRQPPPRPEKREKREEPPAPRGRDGARPLATPAVRKHARDLGVDFASITGTGPDGHVTHSDVERAASGHPSAAPDPATAPRVVEALPSDPQDRRIPVRGVRRVVARRMARSWAQVPHVTTYLTVDATELEDYRDEIAFRLDVNLSVLPVIVRALAEVVHEHPKLNAWFDEPSEELVCKSACHAGIATDTEVGLMVPVVRDVGAKGMAQLSEEIAELVGAAREGRATPEQLGGSTITVSNVGTFGAEYGTPIINLPEVAILAVGVVAERPIAIKGRVEARQAVTMSLSFDHRVLDGAEAGRALAALRDLLEDPDRLRALPD